MFHRLCVTFFLLFLLAGAALFWSLRTYRVFTREEWVAQVACEAAPIESGYSFILQLTPIENGHPAIPKKYEMNGDQFMVDGDFLKWSPQLNLWGLHNRHKLTRLSSRYWSASDELSKPRTVYELNGGSSIPWRWLYQYGIRIPFVDAVYGSAAYVSAEPGQAWGVYVAYNGYLLRPWEDSP